MRLLLARLRGILTVKKFLSIILSWQMAFGCLLALVTPIAAHAQNVGTSCDPRGAL
jgi:hypothetical protein